MKTLHLVLKRNWYEKIASGEKTSEYRECSPYWNRRFTGDKDSTRIHLRQFIYKTVVFHKGYTKETMEFEIKSIGITTQENDLGLDKCWEIKLGDRLK